MVEVTLEEFKEMMKNNPDVKVKFLRYYRYTFWFAFDLEGYHWSFSIGGISDDINCLYVEPYTLLDELLSDSETVPEFIEKTKIESD